MAPVIGKAKFYNFPAYIEWHQTITREHAQQLWQHTVYSKQSELGCAYDNIYTNCNAMGFDSGNQYNRDRLTKFQDYLELTDQPWDVRYVDPEKLLMVISYGEVDKNSNRKNNQFLIENWPEYIEYTPFADYSAIPMAQLRQLAMLGSDGITGGSSMIPQNSGVNLSVADVRQSISVKEQALEDLKAKVKAVEDGESEELAPIKKKMEELQAQMQALQQKKLDELSKLQSELHQKLEEMNKQIFILESEIYSIRCFLGETVNFVKLRSGKNAPLGQPVVLYQKMRFMLEDLGKFRIMWPEEKLGDSIEKALAKSDKLLDAFAPATKCITLIRYSETGKILAPHDEIRNCLETYELLHGNQVAILIRNGENLFIGWCDEDKISMRDDFFLKPTEKQIVPLPERRPDESEWAFQNRMERYEKDMEAENKRNLKEGLSRYFLFAILNGVSASEHSILPLPKFANAMERSRHILFSMADGALTDNRFGNFGDIIARCNATVKKGDHILTTLSLYPERCKNKYSSAWHNSRGRGEKNRTHDVSASDCTIYTINLVELDRPKKKKRYRVKHDFGEGKKWYTYTTDADRELTEDCEILEYFDEITQHNFISLEKDSWWRYDGDGKATAHANFEVFTSEYINLTFMNSVWLNYVLSTKSIHGWQVTGKEVNYAYALRYIGKALEFIKEREKTERENIILAGGEAILADPDWPVALSEWKLTKGVRNLTEYQAKRFVKAMIAGEVDTSPKPVPESNIKLLEDNPWAGW